jgi:hypothetical protein
MAALAGRSWRDRHAAAWDAALGLIAGAMLEGATEPLAA